MLSPFGGIQMFQQHKDRNKYRVKAKVKKKKCIKYIKYIYIVKYIK